MPTPHEVAADLYDAIRNAVDDRNQYDLTLPSHILIEDKFDRGQELLSPATFAGAEGVDPSSRRFTDDFPPHHEVPLPGGRTGVVLLSDAASVSWCENAILAARQDGRIRWSDTALVFRYPDEPEFVVPFERLAHRRADGLLLDATPADDKSAEAWDDSRAATPADLSGVARWHPSSLAFGEWDSHGRMSVRRWRWAGLHEAVIVGVDDEGEAGRVVPVGRRGLRADPVVTGSDVTIASNPDGTGKAVKASEFGVGQVPYNGGVLGVTATRAERRAVISFGGARQFGFGRPTDLDRQAAGRALAVCAALLGDRLAFARPGLTLRAGCDLTLSSSRLTLPRALGADPVEFGVVDAAVAIAVWERACGEADGHGIGPDVTPLRLIAGARVAKARLDSLTGETKKTRANAVTEEGADQ